MMDASRFHNALRIMMNLDRHHLVEAGVIAATDEGAWKAFRDYPHEASLHLRDENFDRLFALIESRQPKRDFLVTDLPASVPFGAPASGRNIGAAEFLGLDFEDRSGESA